MQKILKKIVYSSVGFVSLTADRMKTTIEGLVDDGKISEEEGESIVSDFTKNTETKRDEIESQFKTIIEKVLKSFNFATSKDVESIENRIAVLETLLVKLDEDVDVERPVKKVVKKPSTKKVTPKKDTKK